MGLTLDVGLGGLALRVEGLSPAAAGGGTDAVARIIGSILERELGQPVNVVNRTGGSGVVGHSAIALAPADGYTLGIVPVEVVMMRHIGLTELGPSSYTPLALVNEDPAGVHVTAESRYATLSDLVTAIKDAKPGALKASGVGQGGVWHVALIGWLTAMGLKGDHVRWVPSNGAAPALQDLAAGGLDIVTCSVPEASAMRSAGKVRSLAIMGSERNPVFPDIPTVKEASRIDFTIGAWRGFVGPKGLPDEVAAKLIAALKKAYESKEYTDFMRQRGFGVRWAEGLAFGDFMAKADEGMKQTITEAGLGKT